MYDWLYEKAHLIASPDFRYKCNYSFESAFAYTSWPNAERTEARVKNAQNHINNALRWAKKFLWDPEDTTVTDDTPTEAINYYENAKEAEREAKKRRQEEIKRWKDCKDNWQCKE